MTLTQSGSTLTFSGTVTGYQPNTRYMLYLWTTYPDGVYRGEYYTYVTTDASGQATFMDGFTAPSGFPTTQGVLSPAYAQAFPPHSQGNYEQNYPVLSSASSSTSDTSISGTLNGQANTTFRIEFFSNSSADPSGYGQGQTYLGYTNVTTDANGPNDANGNPSGNASFTVDLPIGNLSGQWITATATDPNGNTSEFSAATPILAPGETFAQFLQGDLPQSSTQANSLTIVAGPSTMPDTVINAVNALTNVTQPVTIVLDLGGGTYSANGAVANPPPNVTFKVQNGTLDPDYPALTVAGGQVAVSNCTLTTSGNSPTLLVTGGSVTLSNDTISQTSTASVEPAISVTGGTVNLGTATSPGNNTLSVSSSGDLVSNTSGNPISAVGDTFTVNGLPLTPSSLSGTVFEDFNDDGQIDFGEEGIANVLITLTGTDDLGDAVSQSQLTDSDGAYVFLNLRPGNYTITETQPSGYAQGIDSVGTAGGTLSATDQFSVNLAPEVNGLNYNFGEQPAGTGSVQKGQAAGIGFWNNKNGQALILAFNGGTGTQLADWLAATLPNMFGANAGSNDLAGKSNASVAARFQSDFVVKGTKLDAQVLATALSVYATNATLDNTDVAAKYGFVVSGDGVGTAGVNVGSNGDAFGVANNTVVTVLDLLKATDAQAVGGLLYNGDAVKRKEANSVYSAINDAGNIS